MSAIFPGGTFSWTNRIDDESVVFSNDVNSLAAEIIATETTLGVNPQIEKHPIIGTSPINYASVDARISDTLAG